MMFQPPFILEKVNSFTKRVRRGVKESTRIIDLPGGFDLLEAGI
jgi:hypothetical protein